MADLIAQTFIQLEGNLLVGPVSEIDSSIFSNGQFLAIPGPPGVPADLEAAISVVVEEHIQSPEPHPAYDDLPSFTLLFENGLV